MDAGSKDLAVSYNAINNILIPCLGKETHRILIAINQADMAMKGRNWDDENNLPKPVLTDFLNQKVASVKRRVFETTGVVVYPIFYCAGYTNGEEKQKPYNLSKLLYYILTAVPSEKRLIIADNLNASDENWEINDADYSGAIKESFRGSLFGDVIAGAGAGAVIGGCSAGIPGAIIGGLIGAIVGGLKYLFSGPTEQPKPINDIGKVVNNIL